ncbi:MAG: tryptophan synthase subunit beta, partial [Chloroflexota bacterium]
MIQSQISNLQSLTGKFGPYGGQFVPETLMPALDELVAAYDEAQADKSF